MLLQVVIAATVAALVSIAGDRWQARQLPSRANACHALSVGLLCGAILGLGLGIAVMLSGDADLLAGAPRAATRAFKLAIQNLPFNGAVAGSACGLFLAFARKRNIDAKTRSLAMTQVSK